MKTLSDIKQDMSEIFDELREGTIELPTASELANIAGKIIKVEALELAKDMFYGPTSKPLNPAIEHAPRSPSGRRRAIKAEQPQLPA
jgi:hypothetical protein